MVIIRLSRAGAKKRPFYHLVATDSRSPRDGRYLERLGYYNPIAAGGDVRLFINKERVSYWTGVGAQASERVQRLLKDFDKTNPASAAAEKPVAPQAKKKPAAKKAATAKE